MVKSIPVRLLTIDLQAEPALLRAVRGKCTPDFRARGVKQGNHLTRLLKE